MFRYYNLLANIIVTSKPPAFTLTQCKNFWRHAYIDLFSSTAAEVNGRVYICWSESCVKYKVWKNGRWNCSSTNWSCCCWERGMYRYLILCLISSLHSNLTFKCCLLSLIVLCGIYPLSELAIQNLLQLKETRLTS